MHNTTGNNRRKFLKALGGLAIGGTVLPVSGATENIFPNNTTMNNDDTTDGYAPPYLELHSKGELRARAEVLWDMMRSCSICPRECGKDRISGQRGDCSANANLEVSSYNPHFGEERELVGRNGSGTIFFTNCSLLCVFCINYDVSQMGRGRRQRINNLSDMMLSLQRRGCHNINLVTPTHYAPHILKALDIAAGKGLKLPIVYNTCGWEKLEVLQLLNGIVDVYLADFKYDDPEAADKYSPGAKTYPEVTKAALLEMQQQVGTAYPDVITGLMNRGLMIRHLVMPNNVARSEKVMQWIGENLPKDTYVNIMSQYRPMFKAHDFPEISRGITRQEYTQAVNAARRAGLTNLHLQGG
jgi:putative pyruvate formate lyase activating enzyme